MRHNTQQTGASLITAIFLLVGVAVLLSFTINISGVQRDTSLLSLKAARALQAARSGIEWGSSQALNSASCTDTTFDIPASGNMDFSVNVVCTETTHIENITSFTIFNITSTATHGTYGGLDFVSRSLNASVSVSPP